MNNLRDLLKPVVHVKSVRDNAPNEEGVWVTLSVSERYLSPKTDFDYLSSLLPAGQHAVAVRR